MSPTLAPNVYPSRPTPITAVVGAQGFLGGSLLRTLRGTGAEVHGFTSNEPALRGARADPAILDAELIFYLAGRVSPAVAERDPDRIAEDHTAFLAFLHALRESKRRPIVVLAGSGGTVYDTQCESPYSERSAVNPTTAYGKAKLEQEEALASASQWLAPVVLRLSNVYGPGQRNNAGYGVIGHWMKALLADERLVMFGHGGSSRDYIHIDDVTDAMLRLSGCASSLRCADGLTVLNIGAGEAISLDELHRSLEVTIGRPVPLNRRPARSFDRKSFCLDVRLAADVLGWRPKIGLTEGLADTWRYHLSTTPEAALRPAVIATSTQ